MANSEYVDRLGGKWLAIGATVSAPIVDIGCVNDWFWLNFSGGVIRGGVPFNLPVDVVCEVLRRAGYTVVEPQQAQATPLPEGWTIEFSDTLNSWVAHNGHLVAYGHDEEACRNNAQAVQRMHAVASPNYRSTCTRCDDTGLIGSGVFLPQEPCPDCGGGK